MFYGSDGPNDIVFRVHYNGMFFFDPLGYYQGRVVEMDGYSKDSVMYTHLLNMLAAKIKGNIWALFCCIPEIKLQNGGLKIIKNDVDVHAMYDLAKIHKKFNVYVAHKWGENIVATVIQDDVEDIDADVFEVLDSIDAEALAKQQKLDKGKEKIREADIFTILETDKEECTQSLKFEDVLNNDVVLTPLVKEHERNMQYLLKKLKGNHIGITDPFAIVKKQNEKFPFYDQQTHWKLKKPKFKECLTYYALANGFSLWFDKSASKKVIAKCGKRKEVIKDDDIGKQRAFTKFPCNDEKPICKLRCYGKMMKDEASFQVRSLVDEHTFVKNFQYGKLVDYKWIGRNFCDKISDNPQITLDAIVELVVKKYKCIVSHTKCRHAKSFALNEGDAAIQYHYGYLRFYVCFQGLKEGWKLGCRRVIALDGCFLKKPNSEEILKVVGRDGNNHIFPVAWAIVTVENKHNWNEMGASNSKGEFYDRRVNNKKRGASCSNANQNRRVGKTKGGRVFPTQGLGRMAAWFGIDLVNSDIIENTQAANALLPTNNTQAGNIPGTQQSQVLPTTQESTRTERTITRRVVAKQMLQTRSEGAAQRQAKQRQPSNFVLPRKKSETLKT
uniref:Pentatricopeptide repeat-containing protein n=1 Tax=Tanacetum cinerariifolium TaxID=118510 RepID=A0A6L2M209_TANCI|nr:pentatricopeptide repeat-containing protein [Tanacetum cinerariifolium]